MNEEFVLIEPTEEFLPEIARYRADFLASGDSMDGTGSLRRFEDPTEWLEHCRIKNNPATVPEGRVASTQLIYVGKSDGRIVGMLQIRHTLNGYLREVGGHIGYSVRPSDRKKGVASAMLRGALPLCKRLGIDRVLVTCYDDNEASRKVILKNGGICDGTATDPENGKTVERYWIEI